MKKRSVLIVRRGESLLLNIPKTLLGLQDFDMAGHWISPGGGLHGAAMSIRAAVKLICNHEKKRFVSIEPQDFASSGG